MALALISLWAMAASGTEETEAFDRGVGKVNSVFIPK